jgi:7-cyano-7-deazaguanine reductase
MSDKLTQLGHRSETAASPYDALLERIAVADGRMLGTVIRLSAPEFTSICPVTGQPDFATIYVDYVPRNWLIESKSYKLFLGSFRSFGTFHEEAVAIIRDRLVLALDPVYLRAAAFWYPRGGIPIDVFCQYGRLPANCWAPDLGIPTFRGR